MVPQRVVLWIVFAVVHVAVAVLGRVLPNQPMGDVYLVYEPWSARALAGDGIVGITEPWVYPALALAPMILAHLLEWLGDYTIAWAVLVTACDAAAFALLVGRGRSASRNIAAWFWLAFAALLGPIGMYRIDAVTVPLAVAGLLWLVQRPGPAGALLAAATWIKVWPAALLAAAFMAIRRRAALVVGALVASAVVAGIVVVSGGAAHLFDFVTAQTDRGLQIESPVAGVYLWGASFGLEGWSLYYDRDLLTFQVTGPQVDAVVRAMTPVLAVAAAAILVLGGVQAWRGASVVRLQPPLALALVLAFIVFNKVGSPQFQVWLIAPLVLWLVLDRRRAWPLAALGLGIAALTQLVYPVLYGWLLIASPWAVLALTARNACLIVLLVWTVWRIAAMGAAGRSDVAPS